MDKETKQLLRDILFQLHVITTQNFYSMMASGDDEKTFNSMIEYGKLGLEQEIEWMKNNRDGGGVDASV